MQGHDCHRLGQDYKQQRSACNRLQDELDSAVCAQVHKQVSCDRRLACEATVLDAMNTALDTMEAQGREYFGLAKANSSVACLLSALRPGETTDGALKSCHKLGEEHDVEAYMLSLPSLPQMTTCEPMAVLQQGVSGGVVDYSDLPRLAPSKTCSSACCSSLLQEDPITNSEDYEQAHDEKPPITLEGCVAWFRAEDAAEPWPSTVGSHQGHVVSRKSDMGLEVGHGAKKGVRFLRGDEKTRFDFGEARDVRGVQFCVFCFPFHDRSWKSPTPFARLHVIPASLMDESFRVPRGTGCMGNRLGKRASLAADKTCLQQRSWKTG